MCAWNVVGEYSTSLAFLPVPFVVPLGARSLCRDGSIIFWF